MHQHIAAIPPCKSMVTIGKDPVQLLSPALQQYVVLRVCANHAHAQLHDVLRMQCTGRIECCASSMHAVSHIGGLPL